MSFKNPDKLKKNKKILKKGNTKQKNIRTQSRDKNSKTGKK